MNNETMPWKGGYPALQSAPVSLALVWWLLINDNTFWSWHSWDFGDLEWVLTTYIQKSLNKHFLLRNCFLSHHPRLVWDQISSPGDPSAMGRDTCPGPGCSGHRGAFQGFVDYFSAESSFWFSIEWEILVVEVPLQPSLGWVGKSSPSVSCQELGWLWEHSWAISE